MSIILSNRVQKVKPSPTLAITAQAAELRAQGKDIIGLGAGEPDFDTPEHIKAAAVTALRAGMTKYTPVDGTTELKQAVIDKFQRDNNLCYEMDQVLVSCGGKQSFYNLCQAMINPGDEVVIPAPYWVSYPDIVLLADGIPVIARAGIKQQFKITAGQLDAALTDKTRLFVINSPSNPTGVAYSRSELESLGEILHNYPKVLIATDDMYEHIIWGDEPFCNIATVCPELMERTIVLNGVSKAYAMTGWRIGYAGGPASLIKAMKKIQSQSTSNPASISQAAAVAALSGDQSCITAMVNEFKKRHDYVVDELNNIPGISCLPGDGTFYVFPDASEAIADNPNINDDIELASCLLDAGVAIVPGNAFGSPGNFRVSFATSMDNLGQAVRRIAAALS